MGCDSMALDESCAWQLWSLDHEWTCGGTLWLLLDALLAMFWLHGLGALRRVGWGFRRFLWPEGQAKHPRIARHRRDISWPTWPCSPWTIMLGQTSLGQPGPGSPWTITLGQRTTKSMPNREEGNIRLFVRCQSVCIYICVYLCNDCRGLLCKNISLVSPIPWQFFSPCPC